MDLGSIWILPQQYTASKPRRPRLESSSQWKPQNSQNSQPKDGVVTFLSSVCVVEFRKLVWESNLGLLEYITPQIFGLLFPSLNLFIHFNFLPTVFYVWECHFWRWKIEVFVKKAQWKYKTRWTNVEWTNYIMKSIADCSLHCVLFSYDIKKVRGCVTSHETEYFPCKR